MMMASEGLLASNPNPTDEEIRTGISGNICRCTGYNSIVKAIDIATTDYANAKSENRPSPGAGSESLKPYDFAPTALEDALKLRKNTSLIPYSGGTDLMVPAACRESEYLFINNVQEMRKITYDEVFIRIGAACTFTEVIENPLTPTILKEACRQIAAPAIRNSGTAGGNIANGSAKADSALIFMVTDSLLRLVSEDGERTLPIKEFYLGKGKTALNDDELIVEILMPKKGIDNYYYKKVGARNALAISRTSFAGILDVDDGVIVDCATAFGAVIDVIIRHSEIDDILIGKTLEEARGLKKEYLNAYDKAIQPRRGRVGIEYRKDICMNLLRDFLESNGI